MSKSVDWSLSPVIRTIYVVDSGYSGDYGMGIGHGPDVLRVARIVRETEQMLRKDDGSQISKAEAEHRWRDTPQEAWGRHRELVLQKVHRLQKDVDKLLERARASKEEIYSADRGESVGA